MDAKYFEEHICDELEGAKTYIKNAIEIKAMSPSWAKTFVDMSAAELNHATNLFKMFEEYYKKISETYKEVPSYLEEMHTRVVDSYTEKYSQIKHMHDMYLK